MRLWRQKYNVTTMSSTKADQRKVNISVVPLRHLNNYRKIARYLGLFFLQESYSRLTTEADTGGVLYKKLFLKSLQNSPENTCVWVSFFKKLQERLFKNTFFTERFRATACMFRMFQHWGKLWSFQDNPVVRRH